MNDAYFARVRSSRTHLCESIETAKKYKDSPLKDQSDIVINLWIADQKHGGWIHFPYCCYDCDGDFTFSIADYISRAEKALQEIDSILSEKAAEAWLP